MFGERVKQSWADSSLQAQALEPEDGHTKGPHRSQGSPSPFDDRNRVLFHVSCSQRKGALQPGSQRPDMRPAKGMMASAGGTRTVEGGFQD